MSYISSLRCINNKSLGIHSALALTWSKEALSVKEFTTNLEKNVPSMLAESFINFKFNGGKCKRGIESTDIIKEMFRLRMLICK
jgi:hypothetical protein